jgi:hypothetical protein
MKTACRHLSDCAFCPLCGYSKNTKDMPIADVKSLFRKDLKHNPGLSFADLLTKAFVRTAKKGGIYKTSLN